MNLSIVVQFLTNEDFVQSILKLSLSLSSVFQWHCFLNSLLFHYYFPLVSLQGLTPIGKNAGLLNITFKYDSKSFLSMLLFLENSFNCFLILVH